MDFACGKKITRTFVKSNFVNSTHQAQPLSKKENCKGGLNLNSMQFSAASCGHIERVRELVNSRNVNEMSGNGILVLHEACRGGHADVVEWLIKVGANVNLLDLYGRYALEFAAEHPRCLELLLCAGANPSTTCRAYRGSYIPLHYVCGNAESASLLIAAFPIGVLIRSKLGKIALHNPTWHARGNVYLCRVLLNAGSVVDQKDVNVDTPLCLAIESERFEMCRLLFDYGAQFCNVRTTRNSVARSPIYSLGNQWEATRTKLRTLCLGVLELRRRHAKRLARNGRDMLRLVAQHMWSDRFHNACFRQ